MRALVVALAILVSGCVAPPTDDEPADAADETLPGFDEAVVVQAECPSLRGIECFEPTVAVDNDGTLFAAAGQATTLVRSTDGRNWDEVDAPPIPVADPPVMTRGDNTLQVDPSGRLWYSALVYSSVYGGQNVAGMQVARSDDKGDSWAVNHYFHPLYGASGPSPANAVVASDRQWLAFDDDTVWFQYWAFAPGMTFVTRSDNGGDDWSPWQAQPEAIIPGLPVVQDDALWMPHYTFTEDAHVLFTVEDGPTHEVTSVDRRDAVLTMSTRTGPEGWALGFTDGGLARVAVGAPDDWTLLDLGPSGAEPPMAFWDDGVLAATWFQPTANGTGFDVMFARYNGEWNRTAVGSISAERAPSDFSWLARTPDGRFVLTWTDPESGVMVAVES